MLASRRIDTFFPSNFFRRQVGFLFFALFFLTAPQCNNNPYGHFASGKVSYSTLAGDIRTLDPVRVGDTASNSIASNIHDTPYQYHYLVRPLKLIPSMATTMPTHGHAIWNGKAYPTFRFSIKKNLRYYDDPCFPQGKGREITIDDIIFSVKRAADMSQEAFGYPLLSGKVLGFDELSEEFEKARASAGGDVAVTKAIQQVYSKDLPGIRKMDNYTLELLLTGEYPQIIYFFSLATGSPVPQECFFYYNGKNGRPTYDRHPVASGPFYVAEWIPRYRVVLKRNPNYRTDDFYPTSGNPGDEEKGLLQDAGKQLPIVDEFILQDIQAGPTIWTLFEQGYLDRAGIPREVFNQVIQDQNLSSEYRAKGIKLDIDVDVATYWWYFNMKDSVVGNNKYLRQAISLAVNRQEMIDIFNNGRGVAAQSIIPPGIEGYDESFQNPYSRFDLKEAKRLLALAGYPGGIDPVTGKPLRLSLTMVASPGSTSLYRYYIDLLSKININLHVEELDWPTVLEKKQKKEFQMIHGGWHADYPDPQNFLQLLYGPNSNGTYNENSYHNEEFDRLYDLMKNMEPGPGRKKIIRRMNEMVAEDTPFVLTFHPVSFGLSHKWVKPLRPHPINSNQLKYRDLDVEGRARMAAEWNTVSPGVYLLMFSILAGLGMIVFFSIRQFSRMGE